VKRGDALTPFERTLDLPDLVAYSGATWDWHRMHYDREWAAEAGVPAPVVDGQMLGALMAEQVLDHFGPRAFVTNLSFRFRSMVYAGETVRCEGEIVAVADGTVDVALRVLAGARLAADGSATARVPDARADEDSETVRA
jgi:acyl dehydratase